MAEESMHESKLLNESLTLQVLERKIAVARKELNNLRRDVNSMKRIFIQKFKEVKEMTEKENRDYVAQDVFKTYTPDKCLQSKDTQRKHHTFNSEVKPIGFVESCFKEKNGTPRQPSVCPMAKATLSVNVEGFTNPEHSLEGLEKFSHVWIIFHFHQNTNKAIKAKVKPPRLDGAKVGVFASRSPHRPNPIGLTLAKLDGITGNTLLLSGIDLLDGTPVLDIKPYVPDYDEPPSSDNKELLDLESGDRTKGKTMDRQSWPSSVDAQVVDQSGKTQTQKQLDVEVNSVHISIAEWIRKPPIKELNVKFCAEALAQIGGFHGSLLSREPSDPSKWDGSVDNFSVRGCGCVQSSDKVSERLADETLDGEEAYSQTIYVLEKSTGDEFPTFCQMLENDSDNSDKGRKLTMSSKVSDDEKPCDSQGEGKASASFARNNTCDDFKQKYPSSLSVELQSYGTCIYELKMLSSPEEAKKAITDILKADPRSVYRRNRCQDKLYRFSIDTMNVTCKFEGSTAEVLHVEPVYYRKLNKLTS